MVAVSGGADSVALLYFFCLVKRWLPLKLLCIHVNHRTRGSDSDADAEFTASYAAGLGVPALILNADVPLFAREQGLSLEQAGRLVRYTLFRRYARILGAAKVATAHHLDDQAETVLMKIIRGAGYRGLAGISPHREGLFIRPFLEVRREEIKAFLASQGQPWRHDSSNENRDFTRNRMRNELIPLMEEHYNPRISEALSHLGQVAAEDHSLLEGIAEALFSEYAECREGEASFRLSSLVPLPRALKRRLMRKGIEKIKGDLEDIAFEHSEQLLDCLEGRTGAEVSLPGGLKGKKGYGAFRIFAKGVGSAGPGALRDPVILEVPGALDLPGHRLRLTAEVCEGEPFCIEPTPMKAYFDLEKLTIPLFVRTRRDGDRFFPFGMEGEKKIKDFFIDLKIEREMRDSIPLVVDSAGQLLWVVGYRADGRFRVTGNTSRMLCVSALPGSSHKVRFCEE
ncbi:MAG: tRNA lysidine(34) synthetase TilS [Candidatus Eremiobacteraeota bacterium]|nr:tRNA lysidine(34) synthetase TilS [Candidatus Eremiobacteraeota bacterium]